MKKKSRNKLHQKPKPAPTTNKKSSLWMVVIVIAMASLAGVLWRLYNTGKGTPDSPSTQSPVILPAKGEKDQLIGRWTRTDSEGAYVIEINSATADGKLDALYFNPNPIKVGHAEWQSKNGKLVVIVVLRDVNYPGSTYTLNFLPGQNSMRGNYYQAVQGSNFDVEFVRVK